MLGSSLEVELLSIGLGIRMRGLQQEASRLQLVNASLSRYFSPNLVQRLRDRPELFRLGAERRDITFVFTDLADFTRLVESQQPEVLVPYLNEYLGGLMDIAFKYDGTVDKVVGDAVHVMFGAPEAQPDQAARALARASHMDQFAESFAQRCRTAGIAWGHTRIGVNAGPVMVGNFGGEDYFDYTAHGDPINTASRLEAVNKVLGTRICVSDSVVRHAPDVTVRTVGRLRLRGRSTPLEVFEPLDDQWAGDGRLQRYHDAYALMVQGGQAAIDAFRELAIEWPDDGLVAFHLRRLEKGHVGDLVELGTE